MSNTTVSLNVTIKFSADCCPVVAMAAGATQKSHTCRSGSWCHTAASSTLQDAATQNKRKRAAGNPDNIGARLQSKPPVQGKLPGSSTGGASAATGSSSRANGLALPTAVKPEDEAKEQGNAALKQGDYDQVVAMLCLEWLLDVSCRRGSQGGSPDLQPRTGQAGPVSA